MKSRFGSVAIPINKFEKATAEWLYYYSIDQVMETGFPEEFLANGYFNDYETTTGGYPSPSPSYP